MTRGLRRAWAWRFPYWMRVAPGPWGRWVYALGAILVFVPWDALALFDEAHQGVLVVTWCLSVGLGISVGSGRSLRSEDSVWLVQRGLSLGAAAAEDWILDVALLALVAVWWSFLGAISLAGPTSMPRLWLMLWSFAWSTSVLSRTVSGALSAWGAARPSDLTGAIAILSLLAPLALMERSPAVQRILGWAIPPFQEAGSLTGAIRHGHVAEGAAAVLQVTVFVGALLAATYWRMERWKPRG